MITSRKIGLLFGAFFLFISLSFSQSNNVTLEEITTQNSFIPQGTEEMIFLADGTSYAAVADSGRSIVKYDIVSGNKLSKLLDLDKFKELKIKSIDGFEISGDDNTILLYTDKVQGFRRSYTANYFTYNISTHDLLPLSDKKQIDAASISADGQVIAFAWKNNLYLKKMRFGTESAITDDGAKDSIINGRADWVYEEEFGMTRAFQWNATGTDLAFIRFDESKVKSYPIEVSNNMKGDENLYPSVEYVKYPKAGEANSEVSVLVFNVSNKTIKTMNIGTNRDIYIPHIQWTNASDKLAIVRMNRLQNQFDLLSLNATSGVASTIYSESSTAFVDPDMAKSITFLQNDKGFLIASESDGYRHIYHYSNVGIKVNQITKGSWDVTDLYGYNEVKKELYYQSAESSPLKRDVYAISIDGKTKRKISVASGTSSALFNTNFNYFVLKNSSINKPTNYSINSTAGKQIRVLEENSSLTALVETKNIFKKEFFTFKTTTGTSLNGWIVKPTNLNDGAKHPLVLMQYSGPNSQEVVDSWEIGWEQYLAAQGFVVACVDGRGTGARGRDFRNCTYPFLGKLETQDQVETANYFAQKEFIDPSRVAIWGWSFGGYMACNALTNGGGVFKLGIAVAPVTNWKFYDSVYAERFLKRPRDNERGYLQNSPYYQAQNLQGRLFIIHGMSDDNVHFQNLSEYADQLIQNNKQFDMFVYPKRNHFIKGGNTRLHLYNMMSEYLIKNL